MDIQELLRQLSLEEKVSLLSGTDPQRTPAIERLNIPSLKTSDGPAGLNTLGVKAASFPCCTCLAAGFDVKNARQYGKLLGQECKLKSVQVLLGPTICLHRSPLGGRNFESFSECPMLTGSMAVEYVKGVQSQNVLATAKHFVGNEQETRRFNVDVHVDEKTLREMYLLPFEMLVKQANPGVLMSSYNIVNGFHSDLHCGLLHDVLRGEWGFSGFVISDWGGTNSSKQSLEAGLDLEMPGPPVHRGKKLVELVNKKEVAMKYVDESVSRILDALQKTGKLTEGIRTERNSENDSSQTRLLLRNLAADGIVLLQNKPHALPINENIERVAIIGRLAVQPTKGGGGSSTVNPYYISTPFEAIKNALSTRTKVLYAAGPRTRRYIDLASNSGMKNVQGDTGCTVELFSAEHLDYSGEPVEVRHLGSSRVLIPARDEPVELRGKDYALRVQGSLTPSSTGTHTFSLGSTGRARLYVDDELIIDNWDWQKLGDMFQSFEYAFVSEENRGQVHLEAGREYNVRVDSHSAAPHSLAKVDNTLSGTHGLQIGFEEKDAVDFIQEAVESARNADVAIVVVGLTAEWESEGCDRVSMHLPPGADELIARVAEINRRTIVVNQSGSPIAMPWLKSVSAVVQAWYGGQENGNAIADVLFGHVNPSGKLPVTFPHRIEDTPCGLSFPGMDDHAYYSEGTDVGYRHYDRHQIEPLFPFGFGLSYTSFQVTLRSKEVILSDSAQVQVEVKNTGSVPGAEVVQVYVSTSADPGIRRLQGFCKVHVRPGATETAIVTLTRQAVRYWQNQWRFAPKGEVYVGTSSRSIVGKCLLIVP